MQQDWITRVALYYCSGMIPFRWSDFDVIADSSATLAALGAPAGGGGRRDPEPPTAVLRAWSLLSTVSQPRVAPSTGPARGTMLLVDAAAGSQFDALAGLPREAVEALDRPLIANAAHGRSFHGNRGRPWRAARGNLHLSALFPCDISIARCGSLVSATACLAACDAILGVSKGDVRPEIKWVNDVRLGPAKVAGILTTARAVDGRLRSVVFGIGLNVLARPEGIEPTPFVPVIGNLADRLPSASIGDVWAGLVAGLMDRFDLLLRDPDRIARDYAAFCGTVGRAARLYSEDATNRLETLKSTAPLAKGRVSRLDESLGIVFDGGDRVWTSGRLAYEDECAAFGV